MRIMIFDIHWLRSAAVGTQLEVKPAKSSVPLRPLQYLMDFCIGFHRKLILKAINALILNLLAINLVNKSKKESLIFS